VIGRRGSSLLDTLLIVTLAGVVTLVLAAVVSFHVQFQLRVSGTVAARDAAESALSATTAEVLDYADHGNSFGIKAITVRASCSNDATSTALGLVTFGTAISFSGGTLQPSLNNWLTDSSAVDSAGRVVAPHCVELFAAGQAGTHTQKLRTCLYMPDYPYVLASSGPILSPTGLIAASVAPGTDLNATNGQVPASASRPGCVSSNSAASPAVLLGPGSLITGDVTAVGLVSLASDAAVQGMVRSGAGAVPIPTIHASAYDPSNPAHPKNYAVLTSTMTPQTLEGYWRASDMPLTTLGDLKLENAVLFVTGNLLITGVLSGNGGIVVCGTTTLQHGANFAADNQVAIVSEGDLTLHGDGENSSTFQGLLYTNGNLHADNITLYGGFVANAPNGGGSQVSLSQVTMWGDAAMAHVNLVVNNGPTTTPTTPAPVPIFGLAHPDPSQPHAAPVVPQQLAAELGVTPHDWYEPGSVTYNPQTQNVSFSCDILPMLQWVSSSTIDRNNMFMGQIVFGNAFIENCSIPANLEFWDLTSNSWRTAYDIMQEASGNRVMVVNPPHAGNNQWDPWSLDFNRFLRTSDIMRVELWAQAVP
jgi:hypothetical protein